MVDVQRLRILREVAQQGSFTRAAAVLKLTPSAVSQQIAALERSLGVPVVDRSTRGVKITTAGQVLVSAADAIAAELAHAQLELDQLAHGPTDRLTVATFTSGGHRLLPTALTRFAKDHAEVEFTVLEAEPEESLPLVRTGQADLALAYNFDERPPVRPGDRSGLIWTPLLDDPMWIVLPHDHRLAGRESLALAELSGERWVHGCAITSVLLEKYAALDSFQSQTACRGSDYTFAQSLVGAGVGISMVPQVALTVPADRLAIVPLRPPRPSRYIGVVTARRPRPQPLAETLLYALQETVAMLPAA
jgi:molybdate transport repressor ModE-like protein